MHIDVCVCVRVSDGGGYLPTAAAPSAEKGTEEHLTEKALTLEDFEPKRVVNSWLPIEQSIDVAAILSLSLSLLFAELSVKPQSVGRFCVTTLGHRKVRQNVEMGRFGFGQSISITEYYYSSSFC